MDAVADADMWGTARCAPPCQQHLVECSEHVYLCKNDKD